MEFVPRRFPGLIVGAGTAVVVLALTGVLLRRLLETPVSFDSFILGVTAALTALAAVLFAYWTIGCWRLKYALSETGLTINWGPVRHFIPLAFIEGTMFGHEIAVAPKVRGLNWLGYHVGSATVESAGQVVFYSTHRSREDLVYVKTPGLSYGISPADSKAFIAMLNELKQLDESTRRSYGLQSKPVVERWPFLSLPVWSDRHAVALILAGLAANIALFAYVTYFFPTLPELLPMHFTVLGEVDLIGFRIEVLKLPAIAFVVFACNFVLAVALHSKERLAAYILVIMSLFIQLVFWVATLRIVY